LARLKAHPPEGTLSFPDGCAARLFPQGQAIASPARFGRRDPDQGLPQIRGVEPPRREPRAIPEGPHRPLATASAGPAPLARQQGRCAPPRSPRPQRERARLATSRLGCSTPPGCCSELGGAAHPCGEWQAPLVLTTGPLRGGGPEYLHGACMILISVLIKATMFYKTQARKAGKPAAVG
jgi:hypothetical protein